MRDAEYCSVPLRRRSDEIVAYTLVDTSDFEWASQWSWSLTSKGYVGRSEYVRGSGRNGRPRGFLLHRELMGLPKGDPRQVDHINRDRLDNRRANLRVVTTLEQAQNLAPRRGCASSHRGVYWSAEKQRWQACVQVNGRRHRSPYFRDELDAAAWALEKRQQLMTHAEG